MTTDAIYLKKATAYWKKREQFEATMLQNKAYITSLNLQVGQRIKVTWNTTKRQESQGVNTDTMSYFAEVVESSWEGVYIVIVRDDMEGRRFISDSVTGLKIELI
jgi:hypothetical protein